MQMFLFMISWKRCALNEEDEIELKEYIESKGMIFISTPFSRAAANRLERMNVTSYKIGSGECNNYPLIEYIASFWETNDCKYRNE